MPQPQPPSTPPADNLYAHMGGEIDRLRAENALLRQQNESLGRALASPSKLRTEAQMEVWTALRDHLVGHAARHGSTPAPYHEAVRRAAADYCSAMGTDDLAYYRRLNELFAHIDDDCEAAAEQHDLDRSRAAAPHLSVGIGHAHGDIIESGGVKRTAIP